MAEPHWLNVGPMPDGDPASPLERAMQRAAWICYFFAKLEKLETEPCDFIGGSFVFRDELIQVARDSSEGRH